MQKWSVNMLTKKQRRKKDLELQECAVDAMDKFIYYYGFSFKKYKEYVIEYLVQMHYAKLADYLQS